MREVAPLKNEVPPSMSVLESNSNQPGCPKIPRSSGSKSFSFLSICSNNFILHCLIAFCITIQLVLETSEWKYIFLSLCFGVLVFSYGTKAKT